MNEYYWISPANVVEEAALLLVGQGVKNACNSQPEKKLALFE